jgi:hypothetical protein
MGAKVISYASIILVLSAMYNLVHSYSVTYWDFHPTEWVEPKLGTCPVQKALKKTILRIFKTVKSYDGPLL